MAGIVTTVTATTSHADDPELEYLKKVTSQIRMFLHPSRASNVERGAREILNSLLLKFDDSVGGVILAYTGVKLLNSSHKLLALFPYFSVRLQTQLLVFSPKEGMIIEGKVNKVEKDYIGMLVLGLFNAAIGSADMREDLYYDDTLQEEGGGAWLSDKDQDHCIKLGSRIAFLVKSVQEEDEFIDITGSLAAPNTGALDWLHSSRSSSRGEIEAEGDKKKKRKRKDIEDASVAPSNENAHNERDEQSQKKHKKLKTEEAFVEEQRSRKAEPAAAAETKVREDVGESSKKRKKKRAEPEPEPEAVNGKAEVNGIQAEAPAGKVGEKKKKRKSKVDDVSSSKDEERSKQSLEAEASSVSHETEGSKKRKKKRKHAES